MNERPDTESDHGMREVYNEQQELLKGTTNKGHPVCQAQTKAV